MRRLSVFLVLAFFVAALAAAEAPNPFTSSGGPSAVSAPASVGLAALAPFLRSLTDRLAELTRAMRGATTPAPFIALALVSLVYGVFHALGPGHGKTIVSTFFIARNAKLRHSLIAGNLIALVHAIAALGIVLSLYYLVRGIFSTSFENASRIIQTLSFGVIAFIGGAMLVRRILGKEHSHRLGHGHFFGGGHAHEHEHEHEHEDEHEPGHEAEGAGEPEGSQVTGRELAGIALASGIVPCPGASAILLVGLSLNMMLAGVVSVVMISLGMGLTVSVVGAAAILAKRGVISLSSGSKRKGGPAVVRRVVEIAGSTILFVFGLVFFLGQF
jgi:ABC-type nickel/cobalt efflux system permease component RcnA